MRVHLLKPLLILAVLLLVPLAVSAQLACCAGMSSMDSMDSMLMSVPGCGDDMDCCEKADDDPLARRCCEGGERLDRSHAVPRVCAVPPAVLPAPPTLGERTLVAFLWDPLPPPKTPDLFTLHSAFLI